MTASRHLAARHVMIRVDANQWHSSAYRDTAYRLIDDGVCGVGVFLGELEETATMIGDLQQRAGGTLLVAADYEYGLPMRLEGGIAFPRAMALGRSSAHTTQSCAALIAEEARAIGVHWNWAPVADINSNPHNPIINTRSFGESAECVAEHVRAYIRGTQSSGLLSCAKHFPGHGDTSVDSHLALPTIDVAEHVAMERELVPFAAAIDEGVGSIMVGHIVVPFLDAELPASLSRRVITDLLRVRMGYNGLVCTDALDMHAIADRWTSGTAAVMSIKAGADVALMPDNVDEALSAIELAIDRDEISRDLLDASSGRIDAAKASVGIGSSDVRKPLAIDQNTHALVALTAASQGIAVEGDASLLPLSQHKHIAALAVVSDADMNAATTWFQALTQAIETNIDCGYIDGTISDGEIADLAHGLGEADVFVVALFGKAVAYRGHLPGAERLPKIIADLASGRPVIVVACGSPYGIDTLNANCTVYTYSDTLPSIAASILRLIGRNLG